MKHSNQFMLVILSSTLSLTGCFKGKTSEVKSSSFTKKIGNEYYFRTKPDKGKLAALLEPKKKYKLDTIKFNIQNDKGSKLNFDINPQIIIPRPCVPTETIGCTESDYKKAQSSLNDPVRGDPIADNTAAGGDNGRVVADNTAAGGDNGRVVADNTAAGGDNGRVVADNDAASGGNPLYLASTDEYVVFTVNEKDLPGELKVELDNVISSTSKAALGLDNGGTKPCGNDPDCGSAGFQISYGLLGDGNSQSLGLANKPEPIIIDATVGVQEVKK
ncbi:MAG: hypothetical protein NT027_06955 [Proteobacteria bacterium]|nr:hypothetical protein [Pseudomonadota bacterium]